MEEKNNRNQTGAHAPQRRINRESGTNNPGAEIPSDATAMMSIAARIVLMADTRQPKNTG